MGRKNSAPEPVPLETPKTFALLSPITAGDREVTELTLREPTAGDIELLQKDSEKDGAAGAIIKLIARQTKLAPLDVRALGARDFNRANAYLGSFLSATDEGSES